MKSGWVTKKLGEVCELINGKNQSEVSDPNVGLILAGKANKSGSFVAEPKPLTAIIMEATNGDSDADFRMFVHSSVQAVSRTVEVLRQNGRYAPPPGQCAYITHLGLKYRDWPSDKIDAELPSGIRSAHDGFETTFC